MNKLKNIIAHIIAITIAILIAVASAQAIGTLTPQGNPGDDTHYSLNEIYDKLVDFNTPPASTTSPFSVPNNVAPSFHTLTEIYDLLSDEDSDLIPGNIACGVVIFGVEGELDCDDNIIIDNFSASFQNIFTADDVGEVSVVRFDIEFEVTASDTDVYLDKSTEDVDGFDGGAGDGAGDDGEGVVYTVDTTATPDAVTAVLQCISNCGNSGDNTANNFFIADGDTETYRLRVTVTGDSTPTTADFAVWIDSINWDTADSSVDNQFFTSNLGEDSDADTGPALIVAL